MLVCSGDACNSAARGRIPSDASERASRYRSARREALVTDRAEVQSRGGPVAGCVGPALWVSGRDTAETGTIALVFRPLVGPGHREVGGGRVGGWPGDPAGGRRAGGRAGGRVGARPGGRWAVGEWATYRGDGCDHPGVPPARLCESQRARGSGGRSGHGARLLSGGRGSWSGQCCPDSTKPRRRGRRGFVWGRGQAAWRTNWTSRLIVTSLPRVKPPASRAAFQFTPNSVRSILVVASAPSLVWP